MANPLVRRIKIELVELPQPPPPAPRWKRALWLVSPRSFVCAYQRPGGEAATHPTSAHPTSGAFVVFGTTRGRAERDAADYLAAAFREGDVIFGVRRPTWAERLRLARIYE